MLTADILAQNGDFPAQAFVFLAQLVHLQLGLGRILQIFGQLAADMVCILFAFFVHIRIVEGGEEISVTLGLESMIVLTLFSMVLVRRLTYSTGSVEETTYLEPQISTLILFCPAIQTILSLIQLAADTNI